MGKHGTEIERERPIFEGQSAEELSSAGTLSPKP